MAAKQEAANEKLVSESLRADNAKLQSQVFRQSERIVDLEKAISELSEANQEISHAHRREVQALTHLNQS